MWTNAGVIRDAKKLKEGLSLVDDLKKQMEDLSVCDESRFNRELLDAFELTHMINVSLMIMHSALMRKESRGAHFREDFPEKDDQNWLANIVIKKSDDTFNLRTEKTNLVYLKNDACSKTINH